MVNDKIEVFTWVCSECGREIKSLYKNQFDYLKQQHIESHERKNNKKEEDDGQK